MVTRVKSLVCPHRRRLGGSQGPRAL